MNTAFSSDTSEEPVASLASFLSVVSVVAVAGIVVVSVVGPVVVMPSLRRVWGGTHDILLTWIPHGNRRIEGKKECSPQTRKKRNQNKSLPPPSMQRNQNRFETEKKKKT